MQASAINPTEFAVTTTEQQTPVSAVDMVLDSANMRNIMEFSNFMASGRTTIPAHLQKSPADCAAVITQAMQWRMNPFAVAQKTHLVNGTLGYESQLINAAIQSSGVTQDRFHYEWYGEWEKIIGKTKVVDVPAKGDKKAYRFRVPDYGMGDEKGLGVKVWATLKGETEPRVLDLLLEQASVRNSPLWATDPRQQLAYLAIKRWARLYAPDVILGVYSPDEVEEFRPQERDITPQPVPAAPLKATPQASPDLIKRAGQAAAQGVMAYQKFFGSCTKDERKALAAEHEGFKAQAARVDADRTIEASPSPAPQQAAAPASAPAVDDDFVREMDAASQPGGDYVPE